MSPLEVAYVVFGVYLVRWGSPGRERPLLPPAAAPAPAAAAAPVPATAAEAATLAPVPRSAPLCNLPHSLSRSSWRCPLTSPYPSHTHNSRTTQHTNRSHKCAQVGLLISTLLGIVLRIRASRAGGDYVKEHYVAGHGLHSIVWFFTMAASLFRCIHSSRSMETAGCDRGERALNRGPGVTGFVSVNLCKHRRKPDPKQVPIAPHPPPVATL